MREGQRQWPTKRRVLTGHAHAAEHVRRRASASRAPPASAELPALTQSIRLVGR
jgi:hypothetical protein